MKSIKAIFRRGQQSQKIEGACDDVSRAPSLTNLHVDAKGGGTRPKKSTSRDKIDKVGVDRRQADRHRGLNVAAPKYNNNKFDSEDVPLDSLHEIESLRTQLHQMAAEKSSLALELGEQKGYIHNLQHQIESLKLYQEQSTLQMEQLTEENTLLRNRLRDVAHSPLSDNEKQQLLFETHRHHNSAPASIATNVADDGGDITTCTTPEWDKHSSGNVSQVSVACLQDKINQMQETHYSTNEELQATLQELTDLQRQLVDLQQENERLLEEKNLMFDSLCRQTERLKDSRGEIESLKQLLYRDDDKNGTDDLFAAENAQAREQKLVELLKSAQEEHEAFRIAHERLELELEQNRQQEAALREHVRQLSDRNSTLESTLDAKHAEHRRIDRELALARDQSSGRQIEIDRLKDLLDNARTKISELEQDRTLSDKSELDELLDNTRKEKDSLESEVADLKEQLARSRNEIEKLREQVSILQEECKVIRNNAKTTQSDLEYKCEKLLADKNTLNEQLHHFQEAVNELQVQAQCQAEDKRNLSDVLAETQRNLSESERRILSLESELADVKKLRSEENEEWEKFQNDLLTSVRVANDFKMEAQQDLQKMIMENKEHRDKVRQLEAQLDKLKEPPSTSKFYAEPLQKYSSAPDLAQWTKRRARKLKKLSIEERRTLETLDEMCARFADVTDDALTREQDAMRRLQRLYATDALRYRPTARRTRDALAISKPLLGSVRADPTLRAIVDDACAFRDVSRDDWCDRAASGDDSIGLDASERDDESGTLSTPWNQQEPAITKRPSIRSNHSSLSASKKRVSFDERRNSSIEITEDDLQCIVGQRAIDEICATIDRAAPETEMTHAQRFALRVKLSARNLEPKHQLRKDAAIRAKKSTITMPTRDSVFRNTKLLSIARDPLMRNAGEGAGAPEMVELRKKRMRYLEELNRVMRRSQRAGAARMRHSKSAEHLDRKEEIERPFSSMENLNLDGSDDLVELKVELDRFPEKSYAETCVLTGAVMVSDSSLSHSSDNISTTRNKVDSISKQPSISFTFFSNEGNVSSNSDNETCQTDKKHVFDDNDQNTKKYILFNETERKNFFRKFESFNEISDKTADNEFSNTTTVTNFSSDSEENSAGELDKVISICECKNEKYISNTFNEDDQFKEYFPSNAVSDNNIKTCSSTMDSSKHNRLSLVSVDEKRNFMYNNLLFQIDPIISETEGQDLPTNTVNQEKNLLLVESELIDEQVSSKFSNETHPSSVDNNRSLIDNKSLIQPLMIKESTTFPDTSKEDSPQEYFYNPDTTCYEFYIKETPRLRKNDKSIREIYKTVVEEIKSRSTIDEDSDNDEKVHIFNPNSNRIEVKSVDSYEKTFFDTSKLTDEEVRFIQEMRLKYQEDFKDIDRLGYENSNKLVRQDAISDHDESEDTCDGVIEKLIEVDAKNDFKLSVSEEDLVMIAKKRNSRPLSDINMDDLMFIETMKDKYLSADILEDTTMFLNIERYHSASYVHPKIDTNDSEIVSVTNSNDKEELDVEDFSLIDFKTRNAFIKKQTLDFLYAERNQTDQTPSISPAKKSPKVELRPKKHHQKLNEEVQERTSSLLHDLEISRQSLDEVLYEPVYENYSIVRKNNDCNLKSSFPKKPKPAPRKRSQNDENYEINVNSIEVSRNFDEAPQSVSQKPNISTSKDEAENHSKDLQNFEDLSDSLHNNRKSSYNDLFVMKDKDKIKTGNYLSSDYLHSPQHFDDDHFKEHVVDTTTPGPDNFAVDLKTSEGTKSCNIPKKQLESMNHQIFNKVNQRDSMISRCDVPSNVKNETGGSAENFSEVMESGNEHDLEPNAIGSFKGESKDKGKGKSRRPPTRAQTQFGRSSEDSIGSCEDMKAQIAGSTLPIGKTRRFFRDGVEVEDDNHQFVAEEFVDQNSKTNLLDLISHSNEDLSQGGETSRPQTSGSARNATYRFSYYGEGADVRDMPSRGNVAELAGKFGRGNRDFNKLLEMHAAYDLVIKREAPEASDDAPRPLNVTILDPVASRTDATYRHLFDGGARATPRALRPSEMNLKTSVPCVDFTTLDAKEASPR